MQPPVFFDPTGRRSKITLAGVIALSAVSALLFLGLILSILFVPVPRAMDLHMVYPHPIKARSDLPHNRRGHALHVPRGLPAQTQQISAFYVPWDDGSRAAFRDHVADMNLVVAALATVSGPDHRFQYQPDPQFHAILAAAKPAPRLYTLVQNAQAGGFERENTARLLKDAARRTRLLDQVEAMLRHEGSAGVVFDFENLPPESLPDYLSFLKVARARLGAAGFTVTLTAPVDDPDWDLRAFAAATDQIFLMVYDQHSMIDPPGPIAAQDWFNDKVTYALKQVPAAKAIIAIGSYAYDWSKVGTVPLSVGDAWLIAHDSGTVPAFDDGSANSHFSYSEDGIAHDVWMLDAVSAWNQLLTARASRAAGVALWRLGSEDPGVWAALHTYHGTSLPDLTVLKPGGSVDVEGAGEILRIEDVPALGRRAVTFDHDRVAQSQRYDRLPTPYVVRRTGYKPGLIALTFDDGPDRQWTPKILDILKAEKVPATFFVVGENALDHPFLLKRMVREGHELGNHTYTHPNLAEISGDWARLELNSTQRVVEAYTGRSLRWVRAPYFGDAEPTTDNELGPALMAQRMGYTSVGLHVDSQDWQRPGVDRIVRNVLDGVAAGARSATSEACRDDVNACHSGQIVLLHDSGGDRAQTLAALPRLIETLKAQGYRFTTVGGLAGLPESEVMPRLTGSDLAQVRFDVGLFMLVAWLGTALKWLFIIAIVLGVARAIILSVMAIWADYSGHMNPPPEDADGHLAEWVRSRRVSVIIPAYNEARVIEASVRRVLTSVEVDLEVVVVDDGSMDDTSAIVARAFADEPRVTLITQANAGKAAAVNTGIARARGEIIIALDADTQFEPETIARLVRWFIRPEIGAVAGNAKVGNRFNFVTRWQAVEYVTAQNLERSALATFGAMMVVPGAVGAWRRTALDAVGGYPHDTLAEDQDLTIAVQRRGWQVAYDQDAVAWTEAPESFAALIKQRYRWAFGTLQCLWKHRAIVKTGQPRGLARIGLPQAWAFQIGFSVVSPLIDLALVLSLIDMVWQVSQHGLQQYGGNLERMLIYWVVFVVIDALCGAIAYALEPREQRYPVLWLLSQRFVYRQIMYYVVLKALASALRGMAVGWGKLERSGRVTGNAQN
ncbi:glycosyltransferase [Asticcacaulis sp. BYS171W]|uniref:Chitooligosaccharide deacetylase n=1 Tax=Asticcacaulis aquaticus TaxID=2984212 RepID=A0ABT5HTN5_9CAUL|nr:glycosyltransferase [Asticcacaulis aquaticus]MDC7683432.1 glycosyltransferase [Asticcacaulis aquaticus]